MLPLECFVIKPLKVEHFQTKQHEMENLKSIIMQKGKCPLKAKQKLQAYMNEKKTKD